MARRLPDEGIATIFATRTLAEEVAPAVQGVPKVVIGGLDAEATASLSSSIAMSTLRTDALSRLVAEGAGPRPSSSWVGRHLVCLGNLRPPPRASVPVDLLLPAARGSVIPVETVGMPAALACCI